jgi:hypothetical protein
MIGWVSKVPSIQVPVCEWTVEALVVVRFSTFAAAALAAALVRRAGLRGVRQAEALLASPALLASFAWIALTTLQVLEALM